MHNKMTRYDLLGKGLCIAAVAFFVARIFTLSDYDGTSDTMVATMIADGIVENGFSSLNNYISQQAIMPMHFLYYWSQLITRLFTTDLNIVTKIGYIANSLLLIAAIVAMSRKVFRNQSYVGSTVPILLGMGSAWFITFVLYDPFYTIITVLSLVLFMLVTHFINSPKISVMLIIAGIIIYFCAVDIRLGSAFCLPFLVAYTFYYFIENWNHSKPEVFKSLPQYLQVCFTVGGASVGALLFRHFLISNFYINERIASGSTFVLSTPENIVTNTGTLLMSLVSLFGYPDINGINILSLHGITIIVSILVTVSVMFIFPFLLLRKYNELSTGVKVFTLYYVSNFMINFAIVSLSTTVEVFRAVGSWGEGHYFVVCQVQAIILTSFYVWKYMWPKGKFILRFLLIAVFLEYCVQSAGLSVFRAYLNSNGPSVFKEISKEIEASGYEYGYATYWNGVYDTVLSKGRVKTRGIVIQNNSELLPFNDYTFRSWFQKGENPSKTFLLLTDQEAAAFDWAKSGINYEYSSKVGGYNIYFLNYDLSEKFKEFHLADGETKDITNNLNLSGNAEMQGDGSIKLLWGGISDIYLRYPERGEYSLRLNVGYEEGSQEEIKLVIETSKSSKKTEQSFPLKAGENDISFQIDKPLDWLRIYVWNNNVSQKDMTIYSTELQKLKQDIDKFTK